MKLFGPGKRIFGPGEIILHGPLKSLIVKLWSNWSNWSKQFYDLLKRLEKKNEAHPFFPSKFIFLKFLAMKPPGPPGPPGPHLIFNDLQEHSPGPLPGPKTFQLDQQSLSCKPCLTIQGV